MTINEIIADPENASYNERLEAIIALKEVIEAGKEAIPFFRNEMTPEQKVFTDKCEEVGLI